MIRIVNEHPIYHQKYRLPEYAGNPLIEALSPPPLTKDEAVARLTFFPEFHLSEKDFTSAERISCLNRLKRFMYTMDKQASIYRWVTNHLMCGLALRNPLSLERSNYEYYTRETGSSTYYRPSTISLITGPSGVGKTALVLAIMQAIGANLIRHREYHGKFFRNSSHLSTYRC